MENPQRWYYAKQRVPGETVGMYGDLQGIAGKSLQEIEGIGLPALEDGTALI